MPYPSFPAVIVVGSSGDAAELKSTRMNPTLVKAGNIRFDSINLGKKKVVKATRPLRIAVTKPQFDNMGRLLNELGEGYRHTELGLDVLLRSEALDGFDVFFITCSAWPREWLLIDGRAVGRQDIVWGVPMPEIKQSVQRTLNRFVQRGGTLYVSDFAHSYLSWAFPHRKPVVRIDSALLAKVEAAEQEWLAVVDPSGGVRTVAGTLEDLKLRAEIMNHGHVLTAAFQTSTLVRLVPTPEGDATAAPKHLGHAESCGKTSRMHPDRPNVRSPPGHDRAHGGTQSNEDSAPRRYVSQRRDWTSYGANCGNNWRPSSQRTEIRRLSRPKLSMWASRSLSVIGSDCGSPTTAGARSFHWK